MNFLMIRLVVKWTYGHKMTTSSLSLTYSQKPETCAMNRVLFLFLHKLQIYFIGIIEFLYKKCD